MATDSQGFKTVASFSEKLQADMCAAMLSDNGIPAAVFGADSSYPSLGYAKGIEVKVNESDYEAARTFLAAASSAE
ncbi:MAG: DUF2007 domain-containing protein [Bacteroidales bacterium]|nr:DUF2007 domain-containing protein [Bacteroidales bacterium]MBP5374369.1 DUF2007 domain-containing protein [Bacteroidales bacterium]